MDLSVSSRLNPLMLTAHINPRSLIVIHDLQFHNPKPENRNSKAEIENPRPASRALRQEQHDAAGARVISPKPEALSPNPHTTNCKPQALKTLSPEPQFLKLQPRSS